MPDSAPHLESNFRKIGNGVTFGKNVSIVADSIEIDHDVVLQDDVKITCRGALKIGHHGIVGSGARIRCNNLTIGDWLYACDGLEIGSGGCNSKESNVTIGNRVGIFERVLINPNSEVTIGDNCGIGREVQIWTHGAWLDPLKGFPSDFGPVSIGDNVWLPARCVVLPNTSIGDNCVIGINSIVNKPIPSGSFAAGAPVRILKEKAYPVKKSADEVEVLIRQIVDDWKIQIEYKIPTLVYSVEVADQTKIRLHVDDADTTFDCSLKTIEGATTSISEDLRDYLRRRGIKIYTDDFFRSV
jgi:acetyltransferase-like isoleucine patch superfamily enzyme